MVDIVERLRASENAMRWDGITDAIEEIERLRNEVMQLRTGVIKIEPVPTRVSIHGMYDMHLFHSIEGNSVEEIIINWLEHNAGVHPAIVGDRKVEDLGASILCPAIVLAGDEELRRVGKMVFPRYDSGLRSSQPKNMEDVIAYRDALLNDPDIPRLLAERVY